jgi:hypothetical protein
MTDFWRTPMGRQFFESTLPELVRQMARIADALEAILVKWGKDGLQR